MTSDVTDSVIRCIVLIRAYKRYSNRCLKCLDDLRDELVVLASYEMNRTRGDASSSLTDNNGMDSVRRLNEMIERSKEK